MLCTITATLIIATVILDQIHDEGLAPTSIDESVGEKFSFTDDETTVRLPTLQLLKKAQQFHFQKSQVTSLSHPPEDDSHLYAHRTTPGTKCMFSAFWRNDRQSSQRCNWKPDTAQLTWDLLVSDARSSIAVSRG